MSDVAVRKVGEDIMVEGYIRIPRLSGHFEYLQRACRLFKKNILFDQQPRHIGSGNCRAVQKTLEFVAALLAKNAELLFCLHPFRNNFQFQRMGERDNCFYDFGGV